VAGVLGRLVRAVADLCYPPWCALCGACLGDTERSVCGGCLARLPLIRSPFCPVCSRPVHTRHGAAHVCGACRLRPHGAVSRVCAAGVYDAGLKRLIHLFKYRRHQFLADQLAALLAAQAASTAALEGVDWLAPIPLHWTRERWRGFNQARALAERVGRALGVAVLPARCLRRVRRTTPQVGLDAHGRRENIRGAFAAREPVLVRGLCVTLVDDVLTTGATAEECGRVLVRAGARNVRLLVLAR